MKRWMRLKAVLRSLHKQLVVLAETRFWMIRCWIWVLGQAQLRKVQYPVLAELDGIWLGGFRIRCAALRQKAFIGFVNLKQFTISMKWFDIAYFSIRLLLV